MKMSAWQSYTKYVNKEEEEDDKNISTL